MTDRLPDPLSDLLREAADVDVTPVPFEVVLSRVERRRRTAVTGVALAAAVVLVGAGLAAVGVGDDQAGPAERLVGTTVTTAPTTRAPEPSAEPSPAGTAGMTASPSPAPSEPPAPVTAPPTTAPTAAPTTPSAPAPRSGQVTLTLEPARASVRSGERLPVTATLVNGLDQAVTVEWCGVSALLPAGDAAASPLTGRLRTFRDRALAGPADTQVLSGGRCPGQELRPGEALGLQAAWAARTVNDAAYDGPITLRGEVSYLLTSAPSPGSRLRANLIAPDPLRRSAVAEAPVRLSGGTAGRMTPAQALDLALASPAFAAVVERTDPDACEEEGDWAPGRLVFDQRRVYSLSVCSRADESGYTATVVGVDAETGAVGEPGTVSAVA